MSGNSTGERLEDGDQRNVSQAEIRQEQKEERFEEGKEKSHQGGDASTCGSINRSLLLCPAPFLTHILSVFHC